MMVHDVHRRMLKEANLYCWVNRPLGQTLRWSDDLKARTHNFDGLEELNSITEWMDKRKITDLVIMIDEGQGYLNARKWELLTEEVQWLLQTHGHYGIDFYLTSQHESRLDIVARQLVQNLTRWKKIRLFGWVLFYGWELDTDYMDDKEKKKISILPIINIFSPYDPVLYDTHAKLIFPKRPDIVEHVFRRCTSCGNEKRVG